ncbi:MAG: nitroreductase family protein [Aureliella sp.]
MEPSESIKLAGYDERLTAQEQRQVADQFLDLARRRRSVRNFSPDPVPSEIIESCISAAATAPSGANQQPWHFVAISDAHTQRQIREQAEAEERELYSKRASKEWLDALAPLGTDANKPFLETAPWLIAIFAESFGFAENDATRKHYYVTESVGIASGILITALNNCGLATLTHTPSPMRFLNEILQQPSNRRPFLLLVVGYPSEGCTVPRIGKKPFNEIATVIDTSR